MELEGTFFEIDRSIKSAKYLKEQSNYKIMTANNIKYSKHTKQLSK